MSQTEGTYFQTPTRESAPSTCPLFSSNATPVGVRVKVRVKVRVRVGVRVKVRVRVRVRVSTCCKVMDGLGLGG